MRVEFECTERYSTCNLMALLLLLVWMNLHWPGFELVHFLLGPSTSADAGSRPPLIRADKTSEPVSDWGTVSLKARSHIPTRLLLVHPTRWSETNQSTPKWRGMSHNRTRLLGNHRHIYV